MTADAAGRPRARRSCAPPPRAGDGARPRTAAGSPRRARGAMSSTPSGREHEPVRAQQRPGRRRVPRATRGRRPGRSPAVPASSSSERATSSAVTAAQPCGSASSRRSVCGNSAPTVRRGGSRCGPRRERAGAVGRQRLDVVGQPALHAASRRSRAGRRRAARTRARAVDWTKPPMHVGQPLHRRDVRPALGLVGVEQRVGRAAEHGGELPGEVGRVARAGREPLPGERRHHVRGVAGQQHAAAAPARGRARVEGVDDGALDLGGLAVEPLADARAGRRRARGTASASSPGCSIHSQRWRPGRHRQRHDRPLRRGRRSAGAGPCAAGGRPARRRRPSAAARSCRRTGSAAARAPRCRRRRSRRRQRAVIRSRAPAAGRPDVDVDAVGAAVERLERQAAAHLDGRPLGQRGEQRPLHRRLVDRDERRVPEQADARG